MSKVRFSVADVAKWRLKVGISDKEIQMAGQQKTLLSSSENRVLSWLRGLDLN